MGVLELVREQRRQGREVALWVLAGEAACDRLASEDQASRHFDCEYRFSDRQQCQRAISVVRQALIDDQIAILHSHLLPADYIAASASRGLAIHVAHIRDTQPWLTSFHPRNIWKRLLYRQAYLRAKSTLVGVSQAASSHIQRALFLPRHRVTSILNGIDGKRFEELDSSRQGTKIVFGTAGRLSPEKGHADLLQAFAQVTEPSLLKIVGSGSQLEPLQQLAETLRIQDRVEFLGPQQDMGSFYTSLDAFVLPSRSSEGLARVVMEAMWCGIAVIATDVSGTRESIRDRVTGLIVPPHQWEALAKTMNHLAQDSVYRVGLGETARAFARSTFDVQRVAQEFNALYDQLGKRQPMSARTAR